MKTQIIQLEPHDDATSVKDKMEWRQTSRILLIWPVRGRILNRRLDLVYLKRHAASLGAQLALVTQDADIRFFAAQLDIPVYVSVRKAEQSHWRRPRKQRRKRKSWLRTLFPIPREATAPREKPDFEELRNLAHPSPARWLLHPVTRITLFTLGVMGVLAIAAVLLPSAEIRVTPKTQKQAVTFLVSAHPETESVDISGQVPAQWTSVIVEGRGQIPSSGSTLIPVETAQGEVVFTNLTDQAIRIPQNTIVSTTGGKPIRFMTLGNVEAPSKAESEAARVRAIKPGASSNVFSNRVTAIEGPLGLNLTVTNPERISGGSDRSVPAPNHSDYQNLEAELLDNLFRTALVEIDNILEDGDVLLSADPSDYAILAAAYSPAQSEPADQLELTLQVEFRALFAAGEDLRALGRKVLEANLPEDYSPDLESVEISQTTSLDRQEDGTIRWKMTAEWQVSAEVDSALAIQLTQWRSPHEAATLLAENLPIDKAVAVKMSPDWWPRLPILPFRIAVTPTP